MTDTAIETRSIVVERPMAHPPERIWRTLTAQHLVAEWLMQNDFRMEQSGFRALDEGGYRGMGAGLPRILGRLEAAAGSSQTDI